MSTAFTTITTTKPATRMFKVATLNEICGGVNERYYAVYGGTLNRTPIVNGTALQSWRFWGGGSVEDGYGLQGKIENLVLNGFYYDPVATYSGQATIPPYTLSGFRIAAGIPSGFRRATTKPADWTDYADPAFSYGTMIKGDIIGPWILVDLQRALSAMIRTKITITASSLSGHGRGSEWAWEGTAADALAAAKTDYAGQSWGEVSAGYQCYGVLYKHSDPPSEEWISYCARRSCIVGLTDARLAAIYQTIACYEMYSAIAEGTTYVNADGYGGTEDRYKFVETLALNNVSTRSRTGGEIGYSANEPFAACAVSAAGGDLQFAGIELSAVAWLPNWDFTHI